MLNLLIPHFKKPETENTINATTSYIVKQPLVPKTAISFWVPLISITPGKRETESWHQKFLCNVTFFLKILIMWRFLYKQNSAIPSNFHKFYSLGQKRLNSAPSPTLNNPDIREELLWLTRKNKFSRFALDLNFCL